MWAIVIAWAHETAAQQEIVISQGAVRAVQMAEGAISAASKLLMEKLQIEKLDKVILTGAFGSFIDRRSAATMGIFPDCNLDMITPANGHSSKTMVMAPLGQIKAHMPQPLQKS